MRNKAWSFFVKDGWLTKKGGGVLTIASLALIVVPLWLIYENYLNGKIGLILLGIGSVLGAVVGYEGKAKQSGFLAPFTNDPLGWRKAKQSYQQDTPPEESKGNDPKR
jgi:hypothetical protein